MAAVPLPKADAGINYFLWGIGGRETFQKISFTHPGGTIYHSAAVYMDIYHYTASPSCSSVIDHILLLLPDFAHSLLRRNSFIRVVLEYSERSLFIRTLATPEALHPLDICKYYRHSFRFEAPTFSIIRCTTLLKKY